MQNQSHVPKHQPVTYTPFNQVFHHMVSAPDRWPPGLKNAMDSVTLWRTEHVVDCGSLMYPSVIKRGNGKSHVHGDFNGKIIHKW